MCSGGIGRRTKLHIGCQRRLALSIKAYYIARKSKDNMLGANPNLHNICFLSLTGKAVVL